MLHNDYDEEYLNDPDFYEPNPRDNEDDYFDVDGW